MDIVKDLRPHRVSADLQMNGVARHLIANLELDSPVPQYAFDGDMAMFVELARSSLFHGQYIASLPRSPADRCGPL